MFSKQYTRPLVILSVIFGWLLIVALILVSLVLIFVWPTTYRYDHMNVRGNVYPVRIHRQSGKAEVLYSTGWRAVDEKKPEPPCLIPTSELDKIVAKYEVAKDGSGSDPRRLRGIRLYLYNGSDWTLTSITIKVTCTTSRGVACQDRLLDVSLHDPIRPRTNDEVIADPGIPDLADDFSLVGSVVAAYGRE